MSSGDSDLTALASRLGRLNPPFEMHHGDNAAVTEGTYGFPQNVKVQAEVNPLLNSSYYGQKSPPVFPKNPSWSKSPPSFASEIPQQFTPRMTSAARSFHSAPMSPTYQYSLPVISEGIASYSHHELNSMQDGNMSEEPELHHDDSDAANEQLSQALRSSHEFDKMAFQAVTSAIEDLQNRGILTVSEQNTNEATPFHLNANASKFFLTDHLTNTYAHQDFDPEVQPGLSQAAREEARAETAPPGTSNQTDTSAAYSGVYSEVSAQSTEAPIVIFSDSHKDNKVLAMLKFLVKYTDMEVSPAWLARFLKQPMPDEVRELRQMFDAMNMSDRMDRYWRCTQKQRYKEHFGWLHYLEPINTQMWMTKLYHRVMKPNTYLRRKAMWKSVCYGGPFLYPHYETPVNVIPPPTAQTTANQPTSISVENIQIELADQTSLSNILPANEAESKNSQSTEEAFAEWVKTSGANLRVTIDYAWSELQDGGDLKTDTVEPYRMELVTSLDELEQAIQTFGLDGKHIGNDDAAVYAGILLRFTQALHDYLEMKDKAEEHIRQNEQKGNQELKDNVDEETSDVERDESAESPVEEKAETPSDAASSRDTQLLEKAVSDYEKTKKLLQYLDEVVGSSPGISLAASVTDEDGNAIAGPGLVISAGTVTEDHVQMVPTEIHEASGPLLSARGRFYERRASDTLLHSTKSRTLNQTDSMFSTLDRLDEQQESSYHFNDNFNGDRERDTSVLDKSLSDNHSAEDDGKNFVLHLTQGESSRTLGRNSNSPAPEPINMNINEY